MFERRKILQALAALPMIGDKIVTGHVSTAMNDILNNAPAASSGIYYGDPAKLVGGLDKPHPLRALLGEDYYTIANKFRRRLEDEIKISRFLRGAGGHDADIEAMRSTSRCYRNLKQRMRDQESFRLLQRWKDAQNSDWMDKSMEDNF